MHSRMFRGVLLFSVAAWTFAAFTGPDLNANQSLGQPAIVGANGVPCGDEPAWSDYPSQSLVDDWYSYGDCSGYYGPIDAEGVELPVEQVWL